jgi:Spy/CpxP family protein refolding chaperone
MTRVQIVVAGVLLAAPALAGAQAAPAGIATAVRPLTTVAPVSPFDGIELTVEQRAKLRAIASVSRTEDGATSRRPHAAEPLAEAQRASLQRIAERHNAAVRAVLTPAQLARLDANLHARREHDRAVTPTGSRK